MSLFSIIIAAAFGWVIGITGAVLLKLREIKAALFALLTTVAFVLVFCAVSVGG